MITLSSKSHPRYFKIIEKEVIIIEADTCSEHTQTTCPQAAAPQTHTPIDKQSHKPLTTRRYMVDIPTLNWASYPSSSIGEKLIKAQSNKNWGRERERKTSYLSP